MTILRLLTALSVVVFGVLCLPGGPALAQGIDCSKARAPIDRAICTSTQLLGQDQAMASAFAAALGRDADHAADVRAAQAKWLRDRNAGCVGAADQRAIQACLVRSYAQRLADLAPPAAAPARQQAAVPPVGSSAPAVAYAAADGMVAPPAPDVATAAAAATLDRTTFPAAERAETLLHVTQAGRFAIAAKSPTGTALQLVDMLTGPSDTVGRAGQQDGRLDVLLEIGTYKLRAFGAAQASGDLALSVTPFRDAGPAAGAPVRGRVDAELADFQQRRFWLAVADNAPIRIEAAGRALADLRLWRNGTDLVTMPPGIRTIEPTAAHPLTDIVLEGSLEPGTYELIAYGGPPLAWTDGAAALPFHLRTGASDALAAGWVATRIGPFGSELFRAGPASGAFRLDLPEPAVAGLAVTAGHGRMSAPIARIQRDPVARIGIPADDDAPRLVEVRGAEGQPFQLRSLSGVVAQSVVRDGTYWMSVDAFDLGGDEAPLAYVFTRLRAGAPGAEVVGQSLPVIGPGTAWREKFNLRGQLALPFQVTGAGPVAIHAEGVAVQAMIGPFGAALQPRADGTGPASWDLTPGFYVLQLTPPRDAMGILDLTLGPPGLLPAAPAAAQPLDAALPIGLTTLDGAGRLTIYGTRAAGGSRIGLLARPAPVDLWSGPLAVTVASGQPLDVPVRLPPDGTLVATEIGAATVTVSFTAVAGPAAGRIGTAHVAAADRLRTITLGWLPPPGVVRPVPPPESLPPAEPLTADASRFLDLDADDQHSFALDVATGGLYRVETTGRLRTRAAIGTAFIPDLDHAEANGVGQNALIQRFLRAGPYRVVVGAEESSGHLGVLARPAPVTTGATLVPGGSVRARMAADGGVIFPIEIAARGTFHLDLLSLAPNVVARLEDAEGWPLRAAGDLSAVDQELDPGRYRLLVQPAGVAARIVARLQPVANEKPHDGHGPFALAFDSTARATWHEPPGRDDARAPDVWNFALDGKATVKIGIGDGMVADLRGTDGASVARLTHTAPFAGTLDAGQYRLDATSQGRNDRLDYSITLNSTELQPDRPRTVTLPATVPFALAADRVVSLTSFGHVPVRAVLRRADGSVVGRFGDRGDDWNIGVSRALPAGAYRLEVAAATPPKAVAVTATDAAAQTSDDTDDADKGEAPGDDPKGSDANSGDSGATDQESGDKESGDKESGDKESGDKSGGQMDQAASADTTSSDDDATAPAQTVELRLALPVARDPVAATGTGTTSLAGGGVHRVQLPALQDGALVLGVASSSAELALALERREGDGPWRTVATAQGVAPVVGAVGAAQAAEWRAELWTVDGGSEPIRFAARIVQDEAHAPTTVRPVPVQLDAMPQTLGAARLVVPGLTPLLLDGGLAGIAVAASGGALASPEGAMVLPQSNRIWIVARDRPGDLAFHPVPVTAGAAMALALPADGVAWLQGDETAAGRTRVWLAQSGLGQPGLDSGRGMGVAAGSALAPGGGGETRVFNAGGGDPLRLRATALDLADQTPRSLDGPFAAPLPARSATLVQLPEDLHRIQVDLAPGTAAIADPRSPGAVTVWTGDAPVSRAIEGRWTQLLLVNTGSVPAAAAVALTTLDGAPMALAPGSAMKRFFGAAGSLDLPVSGSGRLIVAGGTATLIGADGRVATGTALTLANGGRVVLDHGPGLLAAWIEGGGVSPGRAPRHRVSLCRRGCRCTTWR